MIGHPTSPTGAHPPAGPLLVGGILGLVALVLALAVVPAVQHRAAAPAYRGVISRGGTGGASTGPQPVAQVARPPTVVPPTLPPARAAAPPPAPTAPPAAPVVAATGGLVLDNPNNVLPPDLDPGRAYGPPVLRTDWVISKDYATHGGATSGYGALDFAYWGNAGAQGSPVVATHAGTVRLLPDDPIYGNWVWVVGEQFTTKYGHGASYAVQDGQQVVRGTVLLAMGSTGQSTGPHVDYQVWENGVNKNPMGFLK